MTQHLHSLLALAIAANLPLAATAAAIASTTPGLLLVETESRVEVDSAGQVVSLTTTPELPAGALAAVEANLRQLRFAPPVRDGRPVAGVTYVQQDACAAPDGGAYRFAVKFRGNGPSLEQRYAPTYPRSALRGGVQSSWKLSYAIDEQGKARIVEAKRAKGTGGGLYDRDFRAALDGWVGALRFRPELVDGMPVATQVSDQVEFKLSSKPVKVVRANAERDRVAGNEACKLALSERDPAPRRIALDSPFKPLPAN